MSKHPETPRFRNLAQESEEGWAIDQLCDLLDAQYAQTEAALTELADGSKPRVITTVEELETLPHGVVIFDGEGDLYQRNGKHWYAPEDPDYFQTTWLALPATVLHTPTPDPTR